MMVRVLGIVCVAVILLASPSLASGQAAPPPARYALIVEGASGEEQYAKMHREWVDRLLKVMRDKFGFDTAHLTVLTETPAAGEQTANAVNLRAALETQSDVVVTVAYVIYQAFSLTSVL